MVEFVDASDDLADSAKAFICLQMARALIEREADLSSEGSVKAALMAEGFGDRSITALWMRAVRMAQGSPPSHVS